MYTRIAALVLSGVIAVSSGSVRAEHRPNVVAGTSLRYTVVTGLSSYVPSNVVLVEGSRVVFRNTYPVLHSLTSVDVDGKGERLFDTGIVGFASKVDVGGVSALRARRQGFEFFCWIQPWMRGRLVVVNAGAP